MGKIKKYVRYSWPLSACEARYRVHPSVWAVSKLLDSARLLTASILLAFTSVSCAQQVYITLHSEPKGARIYTVDEKCIGTTPCTIKLGDLPKGSAQKGEWQLGTFIAYKDGYAPVKRELILDMQSSSHTYTNIFQKKSVEWEFLFDFTGHHQNRSSAGSDFFACNGWLDQNQNSVISYDEFQGIKDHFRAHEQITFVALLRQEPGVNYSYEVMAPDGSIFKKSGRQKTKFKNAMAQTSFNVRDLINAKGIGRWEMLWRIEGNPVARTSVNLTY